MLCEKRNDENSEACCSDWIRSSLDSMRSTRARGLSA